MMPRKYSADEFVSRFWKNVDVRGPDDCWKWKASCQTAGYGQMEFNGKPILAHRISYGIEFGEIPDGLGILHHCDNPPCVNPNHLFVGTQKDNMADMRNKGRQFHVEGTPSNKNSLEYKIYRAAITLKRNADLDAAAQSAGWAGLSQYLSAVRAGTISIPPRNGAVKLARKQVAK